jgi:hypothetical protein
MVKLRDVQVAMQDSIVRVTESGSWVERMRPSVWST